MDALPDSYAAVTTFVPIGLQVFEELQTIFSTGNKNRQPTYEDLQQMEYLERVIKETLRFFPPIPLYGRHLGKETKIGKHLCPAGNSPNVSGVRRSPVFFFNAFGFVMFKARRWSLVRCSCKRVRSFTPIPRSSIRTISCQRRATADTPTRTYRSVRAIEIASASSTACFK